jgi:hypothetical protein
MVNRFRIRSDKVCSEHGKETLDSIQAVEIHNWLSNY